MADKRILVIGGTGYIGKSLVDKLIENDYEVTLLIRPNRIKRTLSARSVNERSELERVCGLPQSASEQTACDESRGSANRRYFKGDLLDKQSLVDNIKNFDVVINLASIVRTLDKEKYRENVIGLKNLIDVMENNKIPRIIYFSTQNVLLKNKGYYSKSKEQCESILKNSRLEYIIIRPNYVYGIDKNNDFYRMAFIIAHFHIAPLIGSGNYKLQPVFKDDLIIATLHILKNFKGGLIAEISGKDTISINNVIELIEKYLEINPLRLHIPVRLLKIFEKLIPFDIEGFTEDRISYSSMGYSNTKFENNLKKILNLIT